MAAVMDEHYQTTGILIPGWTGCGRMEDLHHNHAGGEAVAGANDANWYLSFLKCSESEVDPRRRFVRKGRRARNLAHGKSIQERRQAVEMIQVRVGEEHFIDTAYASTPEKRRDLPSGYFGAAQRTGII